MTGWSTQGRWFGEQAAPLLGWLTAPVAAPARSGVVIVPPVAYEYWSSHRTLRVLAEELAGLGHAVLRYDHHGTGDSAGDQWEDDRLAAWRAGLRAAVGELRALGCADVTLVGARLGAALALLDGAELGAAAVVAWAPVTSGRRYVRQLRMLATPVPDDHPFGARPAVVSAGTVFRAETLTDLAALNLGDLTVAPAPRALIVDDDADALVAGLGALGCAAQAAGAAGSELALERPAEEAVVPRAVVDAVTSWIGPAPAAGAPAPPPAAACSAELTWHGARLRETVIELGEHRLVAIATAPPRPAAGAATVVLLNAGSEPHVGPGRAWVEYARTLAADGHQVLRVDFRGWGESPDDGHAPGRPYMPHTEDDVAEIVRAVRAAGHERIVLVGLCASAWIALRAVLREPVAAVIALNPQLWWRRGLPVESTVEETRRRRAPEHEREVRGARWGLWTALDLIGRRPPAARWLDDLARAQTPVTLVFAEGDIGHEFLTTRTARRLRRVCAAGDVSVLTIPDIDHPMHRAWLRDRVIAALRAELADGATP